MFCEKVVLKICSKFTGEHPCQNVISIKWLCYFIEITLRHRCSPVNLLHICRTPFPKNTSSGRLLLVVTKAIIETVLLDYQLNKTQYLLYQPTIKDDQQSPKIRMVFNIKRCFKSRSLFDTFVKLK